MAEALLGIVTAISNKILPLVADEISQSWGVKKDLQKLAEKVKMMHALISDGQSKHLTNEAVKLWMKKLQSVALDAEIVLDDFGYEVLRQKVENRKRDKVRSFFSSSNPLSFRLEMAKKIKNVSSSLEEAYKEANQIGLHPVQLSDTSLAEKEDRLTDPFVDESEIVGREDDVSQVVRMLISSDYRKELPVISVVGMAGQGKTTLAQLVLKNDSIVKYFDVNIWVCVSDNFKVERLLNEMLQSLGGDKAKTTNREALVRKLQEYLKGKRYMLVLDDIWNQDREKWDCMRKCLLAIGGSQGSKILVTTRNVEVASVLQASDCHHLKVLSDDYSWMLFEKLAFADGGASKTQGLVDIGRRIVKKCGGVPLAIKAIGGLLYSMKEESEWLMIEKSENWNETSNIIDGVFSALKLSYDHLPSLPVKQCFASCSIFPKDSLMRKENLTQMWMARGLIIPPKGSHLQVEDIGSKYFNILLRSSLLQDPGWDIFEGIVACKMHDLVHDLSLQVSNNCFFNTEDGMEVNNDNELVHLTLSLSKGRMFSNMKGIPPKLRTFCLIGGDVLEDILKTCRYLCILIVECWDVTNLPNAIGEMKHLRYLDVAKTGITTLPDSITKLYNLMTLIVNYLKEIPKGFGSLINLRHFHLCHVYAREYRCLFPGIGQLVNLRKLSFFVVSRDKGCQLEELEHMNNLKGQLRIFGLENVSSYESASKANLSKKSNIHTLELFWNDTKEDCEDKINDVMEGLQPHPNLRSLSIEGFKCSKFPSWMMTENRLILLRNLVMIFLKKLDKCEQIPSLGDLPYLEVLRITSLHNVKRIGGEFYGLENLDISRDSSCSSEGEAITLFPVLRILSLRDMDSLAEWSDAMIPSDSSSIKVFPKLRDLELRRLPNLAILPDMENFKFLVRLKIKECRSLACIRNLNNLTSLKDLYLIDCPNLDASLEMKNLQSLRHLTISRCDKLNSSLSNLDDFSSLESLKIYSDPEFWPKSLHHLVNLRILKLGGFSEDLDYFPWLYSISNVATPAKVANSTKQNFVSLEHLALYGWPKITSLPQQIRHLSTLRTLKIKNFDGLEALPEWIDSFRDLKDLSVVKCSNLKQLPSEVAMQNIRELEISDCPILAKRCRTGSGAEWAKIAHIPRIDIRWSAGPWQ